MIVGEYISVDFVRKCYLSLLGRLPDSGGEKHFVSALEKGGSKEAVIFAILSSDEYQSKQKNWRDLHCSICQLLNGPFSDIKTYLGLLSKLHSGKPLKQKLIDLAKVPVDKFYALDDLLIYVESFYIGQGVVFEILGLNDTGRVSVENVLDLLTFSCDGEALEQLSISGSVLVKGTVSFAKPWIISTPNGKSISINLQSVASTKEAKIGRVAIVGRFETTTSIGELSLAFLAQLHSKHNCFLIDTRPSDSRFGDIDKTVSYTKANQADAPIMDVAIYTDVFANSIDDQNYKKVPNALLKVAYVVFDSSRLPHWWVDRLNTHFDAVITTSKWGKQMIETSGVVVPVFYFPLAIDYELYDRGRLPAPKFKKFRFGAIASYSDRKNVLQLVRCFIECFSSLQDEVELVVHSPLNYGGVFEQVKSEIAGKGAENIILSSENLDQFGYVNLLNSFSVLVSVSKGECYSIPPRQAMALGKPVVLSRGHAHDEILDTGVGFGINVSGFEPAFLEAFGGQKIGLQCTYSDKDICNALRYAYFGFADISKASEERIRFAKTFSVESLRFNYENFVSPKNVFLGKKNKIYDYGIETDSTSLFLKYKELQHRHALRVGEGYSAQKYVVPVHDGGFFSVFNTFISHFVWNYGRPDVAAIIPDWRVSTLRSYRGVNKPMSFCYGTESDGNVFTKLFVPIPSMPLCESDYGNDEFLNANVQYLDDFNEKNEPLLTYIHARELYRSPGFQEWREKYGRFYKEYFILKDDLQTEIELFAKSYFQDNFVIGVHVKHPSHAIEQPNGFMPGVSEFIHTILKVVEQKSICKYKIFLATDQDVVVSKFKGVFGSRVFSREGVARTSVDDDQKFSECSLEERNREGHQIQNLIASDPSKWSLNMARDVIIDAHLLARTNCFIHVTSNVATAVSYINPFVEMIYCE